MNNWSKVLLEEMKLGDQPVIDQSAECFAPINIALCKYWGKRDQRLHLPYNHSLSLTIPQYGAWTSLRCRSGADSLVLNGTQVDPSDPFFKKVCRFLDLIRRPGHYFSIQTRLNIPHSAGFASSAAGFAALTLALQQIYSWQCPTQYLAQIARWGSGSATRSLHPGFVHWRKANDVMGRDSYGEQLPASEQISGLCLAVDLQKKIDVKKVSSRDMMADVVQHSLLYHSWLQCADRDYQALREALHNKNIVDVIKISERNARAMHATMADLPDFHHYETSRGLSLKNKIARMRKKGWPIGWTQDAGPQVKILCLWDDRSLLKKYFSDYTFIEP